MILTYLRYVSTRMNFANVCGIATRVRPRGSFSIYEQPKWERIVASTQVGFRVSIWVWIRIRVWIRVRIRVRVRFVLRLFIYRERALNGFN